MGWRGRLVARIRTPLGIALLFAAGSMAWIAISGQLALTFADSLAGIAKAELLKGGLYVLVTASLLYGAMRSWQRAQNRHEAAIAASEARLNRVLTGSNDGWWELDLEHDSLYCSPRWWNMLGHPPRKEAVAPSFMYGLLAAGEAETLQALLVEAQSGQEPGSRLLHLRHRDGHFVPVLTRFAATHDADGAVRLISGTSTDMTLSEATQRRLYQAAAVFDTTREGIVVTDRDARIIMVNRAFTEISGYSEDEVLGQKPSLLNSGRHDQAFYAGMWQSMLATGHWRGEIWNRRRNGEIYPEFLSISAVRDEAGEIINFVGVFADMSLMKDSERKLDFLAHHDALTKLPNRVLLLSRLEQAIRGAQRDKCSSAVLMLDLDRFKDINDSYGHIAGDELLTQVAQCLRERLRDTDTIARMGGDEFFIVLERLAHGEDAGQVAGEVIEWLNQQWTLSNGARVRVSSSIGISVYPDHGETTTELLQHADAAMYLAKQEGGGCFRFFSEHLTRAARERIELENRLHQGIARRELCAFFQPQVDVTTGRLVGAEALVRWIDPDYGIVPPDRFIPAAERSGLINDIGRLMLEQTCRIGKRWLDAGHPPLLLAVNVAPRQFLHSDVHAMVAEVLAETGYPPEYLELELTESALMARGDEVVAALHALRALGVRLAIDDFGTGYSSLAYLKHFPLDVLKIDRSFIRDIPAHQDDMAIAAAIISMGHTLGFKVLAEGVETEEQRAFLERHGCDIYQGYLKSRPVAPEAFERLF